MTTDTDNIIEGDLIGEPEETPAKAKAKTTKAKTTIPAGAKRPEDRKAPKADTGDVTVTIRGVTVTISEEALDDFELMDDLDRLEQEEDASRLPSILRRLVGDQYKTVMDALRGPNGRVGIEAGADFVGEVLEAVAPKS